MITYNFILVTIMSFSGKNLNKKIWKVKNGKVLSRERTGDEKQSFCLLDI